MNWERQLVEICNRQPLRGNTKDWGNLYSKKGGYLRKATELEWKYSKIQKKVFGGFGIIHVHIIQGEGWWTEEKCYVAGGPNEEYEE